MSSSKTWKTLSPSPETLLMTRTFGYHHLKSDLHQLYLDCMLKDHTDRSKIVLDDWTFPFLSNSYQPTFITYLLNWDWGTESLENTDRLRDYIIENNFDGLLVACDWLENPKDFNGLVSKNQFCCWKNSLKQ